MKLSKSMYSDEEIAQGEMQPKSEEQKPDPQAKLSVSEVKPGEGGMGMNDMGKDMGDMEDMSIGQISISSKDNPKVAKWKLNKEYPMRVRMIGSRLDPNDNNTVIGDFEIVKA